MLYHVVLRISQKGKLLTLKRTIYLSGVQRLRFYTIQTEIGE